MLRTAFLTGISLFLLSQIMLFYTGQHDPINASVMMLAALLIALGMLRFFGAPSASLSHRAGTVIWFLGWLILAFMHFDIMALGVTEQFVHQDKLLFKIANGCFFVGAACFLVWRLGEDQKNAPTMLYIFSSTLMFVLVQHYSLHPHYHLGASLLFALALIALAIQKIERY